MYNIDENFEPLLDEIGTTECILIPNYYGVQTDLFYEKMMDRYERIIFDNTQGFFCRPIMRKGVYNVYSPRKFFGVSDGAYLIGQLVGDNNLYEDESSERSHYLLDAIERGTNAVYAEYLENEQKITNSGMRKMSNLTHTLLKGIDYERIKAIRKNNYLYLHSILREKNKLQLPDEADSAMVYPFLCDDQENKFRKYLIENKIYVPQWWKWVLEQSNATSWEKKLSGELCPLPIDQRYTIKDMKNIADIVLDY